MASSVVMEGDGGRVIAAGTPVHPFAGLRRVWLLAAAAALVLAGGAIGLLSSGSHPARAVVHSTPNLPTPSFAGAVPAMAPAAHPARATARHHARHRAAAHRAAAKPATHTTSASTSAGSAVTAAPATSSGSAATVRSTPQTGSSAASTTTVHHTTTRSSSSPAFGANGVLGPGSSPNS